MKSERSMTIATKTIEVGRDKIGVILIVETSEGAIEIEMVSVRDIKQAEV